MYDIADTFLTAGESDSAHADHTAAAAHSPADAESGGPAFPTFTFSLADTRRPSTLSRIVSPTFLSLIADLICELSHIPRRMADVPALTWSYKYMPHEIARRLSYFRGEPPILHPAFAPGSPAVVVQHAEGPIAFDTLRGVCMRKEYEYV